MGDDIQRAAHLQAVQVPQEPLAQGEDIQQIIKGEGSPVGRTFCRDFILTYPQILTRELADAVGEKNANVAEVRNHVHLTVPRGFAITTAAFEPLTP